MAEVADPRPVGARSAAQPRDHVGALLLAAQELALEARLAQVPREIFLRRALVSGRVDGVEADQPTKQLLRLRAGLRAPRTRARHRADRTPVAATSSRVSGKWQAVRVPLPLSSSGGSFCEQSGCALGQRVWKRHPDGGDAGLGTSPLNNRRSLPCAAGSATGTAESSAPV